MLKSLQGLGFEMVQHFSLKVNLIFKYTLLPLVSNLALHFSGFQGRRWERRPNLEYKWI